MENNTQLSRNYDFFICATKHMVKHGGKGGGKLIQKDFANAVGCTPEHLSGILSANQRRKASVGLQERIAEYFNMPLITYLEMGKTLLEGGSLTDVTNFGADAPQNNAINGELYPEDDVVAQVSNIVHTLQKSREENDRLNSILDSLTEAITIMNKDGIVVYQNRSSRTLLRAGFVGKHYEDAIKSTETIMADGQRPAVVRCFESQTIESSLFWIRDKCLSGKASPLYDNRSQFSGVLFSVRDVTDRQKLQEDNEALVSQLSTALEKVDRGICIYDKEDNIIFYNSTFKKFLSASDSDLKHLDSIKKYIIETGFIVNHKEVFAISSKVREQRKKEIIETINKNGNRFLYTMEPVLTAQGHFEGFIATTIPITGKKAAE